MIVPLACLLYTSIRVEVGNTYLPAAITLHKEAEVIRTTEANGEVLRTLHSEPGEGFVFGPFSERDIHENGVTLLADTLVAVEMCIRDRVGLVLHRGDFRAGRIPDSDGVSARDDRA